MTSLSFAGRDSALGCPDGNRESLKRKRAWLIAIDFRTCQMKFRHALIAIKNV